MPQVPYNPVPSAQPNASPTPHLNVDTPSAAFGENIGRALSHLGTVTEHAGTEVFNRAIAMQQLQNETEAKEADSQYMIKAGELHANFNSLQGKARVDAYQGYVKNLQEERVKLRGSLSNDMARKMYDGQSMGTMGRTIFNGAGAAAAAQKEYSVGTVKAQIGLDAKEVNDNPKDDVLFENKKRRTQSNVNDLAALQGLPPESPQAQVLARDTFSKMWLDRVGGLSRTAPSDARTMLDANKAEFTDVDYLKADNMVRNQSHSVDSANIAERVYLGGTQDGKPQKSLEEMQTEAREEAKRISPDDQILANHAVSALNTRYNQTKTAKRNEDIANWQAVEGAVIQGADSIQVLRTDPEMASRIDALPKDKQLALPGMISRFTAARDQKDRQDTYFKLKGQAEADPYAFMSTDVTKEKLSQSQMKDLWNLQQKKKKDASSDPRITHAMQILRPMVYAAGVTPKDSPERYQQFLGALQDQLAEYTGKEGKPPKAEDINRIGSQLLQEHPDPEKFSFGFMNRTTMEFELPVPEKDAEAIKADPKWQQMGVTPSDAMVQRVYSRKKFQELYGGSASAPKVPTSK